MPKTIPSRDRFKIKDGEEEKTIFVGVYDGQPSTVIVEASAAGFADKVSMVVAIDMAAEKMRGVSVTTHKETPGLGARAKDDPSFSAQFAGKPLTVPVKVSKDGGSISAMSGATITSRAVCAGVTQALETYNRLKPQLEEQVKAIGK